MEVVSRVYEAQILPLLSKLSESQAHAVVRKNKALSIGAAVILTMVYVAYSRVAKPPKKLRHIPTANNIKLLRAYLSGWPINEISSKITIPAALKSAHDIYVVSVISSREREVTFSKSLKAYIVLLSATT